MIWAGVSPNEMYKGQTNDIQHQLSFGFCRLKTTSHICVYLNQWTKGWYSVSERTYRVKECLCIAGTCWKYYRLCGKYFGGFLATSDISLPYDSVTPLLDITPSLHQNPYKNISAALLIIYLNWKKHNCTSTKTQVHCVSICLQWHINKWQKWQINSIA